MATIKGWFFPRIKFDHPDESTSIASSESESAWPAPIPSVDGDGMFKVFVLGTRGAGKTVFLASLFKSMAVPDSSDNNFILSCPDTGTFNNLSAIYTQISNPSSQWPAGSMAKQEYVFDCEHIKKDGRRIKLFKFKYYDFPGGFVDEYKSEDETNFIFDQAKSAHSVLVLLDGKKVLDLLEKRSPPQGQKSLFDDLDSIVSVLQYCIGKPIHFAVTKADILNRKVHTLAAIQTAMLKHPQLRFLIEMQGKSHPVHLMPVSAIGNEFARWDPAAQMMVKRPDGFIRPQFVDLSLTLTITDYIGMLAKKVAQEIPATDAAITCNYIWTKVIQNLPVVTTASAGLIGAGSIFVVPPIGALSPLFQLITAVAMSSIAAQSMKAGGVHIAEIMKEFQHHDNHDVMKASDKKSAIEAILTNQIQRAAKFRRDFPDSLFHGQRDQLV